MVNPNTVENPAVLRSRSRSRIVLVEPELQHITAPAMTAENLMFNLKKFAWFVAG
jgi:hypothetical protein